MTRVPANSVGRRTVIIVDDGAATGATARAACQMVPTQGAARILLAVPVRARMRWLPCRRRLTR
ncbi:phosphoribosyltransferase family protein [Nocardia australiensis]|uniref:phosphoribosyltransferase family protein n=1 Tax=Nocardia australiensis TaxID=2887191 RepID=UPI001D15637B